MATDKTKISAYIDPGLLAKAKVLAALNGKSLSRLVEQLVIEAVSKAEESGIQLTK